MKDIEAILQCSAALAAKICKTLHVVTAEDLYAKYIAMQRNNKIFADALGIAENQVMEMMSRLRSALPADRVEKIEQPLPLNQMATGYNLDHPDRAGAVNGEKEKDKESSSGREPEDTNNDE